MQQLTITKVEEDVLASRLRQQQSMLQEILESIELRNASAQDVKNNLEWLTKNLSKLRKSLKS